MTEPKCERPETHDPHVHPTGFAADASYCAGRSKLTDGVPTRRTRPAVKAAESETAA
jgi:hypothetical protein